MGGAASQQQYIIRMQWAIIHSSLFLRSLSMYCMPADPLAFYILEFPLGERLDTAYVLRVFFYQPRTAFSLREHTEFVFIGATK